MEDIREFMEAKGFVQVPRGMTAQGVPRILCWYRCADQVLVYDAKPANFIKRPAGVSQAYDLFPIDLVVSIFPLVLMLETAELNGVEWPEVQRACAERNNAA